MPQAAPAVRSRRKPQATPGRISDADLRKQVKAVFDEDPSISLNDAAKKLRRGRDRVRPLLEDVRREAHVQPFERKAAR